MSCDIEDFRGRSFFANSLNDNQRNLYSNIEFYPSNEVIGRFDFFLDVRRLKVKPLFLSVSQQSDNTCNRPKDMPENEIGRLQVLSLCWDTEKKKWFHLQPPDVKEKVEPTDPLHWTGRTQCWNTSCADCHSTNLQKNFDLESLQYHTTFSE